MFQKNGELKPEVLCPHCHVKGQCRGKKRVRRGLKFYKMHCDNCTMDWTT